MAARETLSTNKPTVRTPQHANGAITSGECGLTSEEIGQTLASLQEKGLVRRGADLSAASAEIRPSTLRRGLTVNERSLVRWLLEVTPVPGHPHLTTRTGVLGGAATIEGTRIASEVIAEYFDSGKAVAEIQRDFPHLSAEEILDARHFETERRRELATAR
jgi:uncharacterized protein (DUF433 family)